MDARRRHLSDSEVFRPSEQDPAPGFNNQAVFQCIAARGISQYFVYQPGDRYWTFQAIVTAIYTLLAAALLALTASLMRRRLN